MPARTTQVCEHRARIERLVSGEASGPERRAAQRHLEECQACRAFFRQQTADRYPRLPHYTILERLGEGGFGVVYKVIHHEKERTEALKILFGKTSLRAHYFQNEVHLVAKLRHPYIAALHEAHLGGPPLYYTMDYVEGERLDTHFRAHQLSLAERIELVKKVAMAVGYAHDQGVVHRDIKPQNIVVDAEGQPRILDFGIARKLGLRPAGEEGPRATPAGVVGTFGYIAPEQMAGEQVDERADIYALGALLYHGITGEPARYATWPERLLRTLHARQVSRSEDLAAIIARCVDPIPEQRYASCAALVEDLNGYLAGRAIRARPHPSLGYVAARSLAYVFRTRPLSVRVLLVAAVSVLLAVLAWRAEARWAVPGASGPTTALVAFTPQTQAAIAAGRIAGLAGLEAEDRQIWRLVIGRVLQRLAEAEPGVVICDYYVYPCEPRFDTELIRGLDALRAARVPVIMGARVLDINSEPEMCPEIRARISGCGTLASTVPSTRAFEWVVPVCVQRGFAQPVPGLAVAGFAAARYPDADLELQLGPEEVVLSYRKRNVVAGEPRWYPGADHIRFAKSDRIERGTLDGLLLPGDVIFQMHIAANATEFATVPRVSADEVLSADRPQLRRWFHGRAVVIGHMIPALDEHLTATGKPVYGCEIHARTVQSLLSGTYLTRMARPTLAATILVWGCLAALLAGLLPCSRTRAIGATAWVCGFGFAAGVLVILFGSRALTDFYAIQGVLAGGAVLAVGSTVYLANALRTRQLQLAPASAWLSAEEATPSTLLAPGKPARAGQGDDPSPSSNSHAASGLPPSPPHS